MCKKLVPGTALAVLLCSALIPAALSQAQVLEGVPHLISYQGRLTGTDGNAVSDGEYTITFRIWSDATSTSPTDREWISPNCTVTVVNGLFNWQLGSNEELPPWTMTNDADLWLGIQVEGDPEIAPRTRLCSAPYAYKAWQADYAGYADSAGVVLSGAGGWVDNGNQVVLQSASDSVGIGTTTPHEQLEITGNLRLPQSTADAGVVKLGAATFIHNFGTNNTFLGYNAGNLTLTGYANTGCGVKALNGLTDGGGNTAQGYHALLSNTSGIHNTANGMSALRLNTTGNRNTATGHFALTNNDSGDDNTAIGWNALEDNTTGYANTAGGYNALSSNTEGYNNTAFGWRALERNTTGHHNTASGYQALVYNTTGYFNTANGISALGNNTEGDENTAVGREALNRNITGNRNTALGADALNLNSSGDYNTACGVRALYFSTTCVGNTASGYYALYSDTTGSYNTAIGYQADVSADGLTNATAIGANATVDASNKIRLGDGAVTVIEGQVAYTYTSDKNEKENFLPVDREEVLRRIRELNLTSWNYKGQDPEQFRHYGPVAQEFFAAFGFDGAGVSGTPTTINSGDMAGIMMIAIQALEERTAEVDRFRAENVELRARLERLEAALDKLASAATDADSPPVSK